MHYSPTPSQLAEFPIVIRIPVQWGELDAYGHVNNAVFFRYFESVRMVYLDRCGFLASYDVHKIGAILHSTACRFRRPLYHPDDVLIGARVKLLETDRFTMEYLAVSQSTNKVIAEGTGVVVSFDYERRAKVPVPGAVRDEIVKLERQLGGLARE
jgi:acyl-CoA thioester hydrolase